jgi:hypothetical protein
MLLSILGADGASCSRWLAAIAPSIEATQSSRHEIYLSVKHETKHKDYQRREDEVTNHLSTWMREIATNLEKNRQHLFL